MIYPVKGWLCLCALDSLVAALPSLGFLWLLIGGILTERIQEVGRFGGLAVRARRRATAPARLRLDREAESRS